MITYLLYTIHVILCLFLILVVLLQQGKGADLSVFGGGTTMTAFGARSATTLLHRLTVGGFVGFVLTTLLIAYVKGNVEGSSVMSGVETKPAAEAPAEPASPAAASETPAAAESAPASEAAPAGTETAPAEAGGGESEGSDAQAPAEQAPGSGGN